MTTSVRLAVAAVALAIGGAACSRPSSPPSAAAEVRAASAGPVLGVAVVPSTTTSTTANVTTSTARPATTGVPRAASPTTIASRAAAPATGAGDTQPDGYGGYGTATSVTSGATKVVLSVYPAEQYFGEPVQVRASVTSSLAIRSVHFDLGDGVGYDVPFLRSWNCPDANREAGAGGPVHTYAVAGQYRIGVVVTVVPCENTPAPAGGWRNPDGTPAVDMPSPWRPTGPDQVVTVASPVTQCPDRPPRPVGPPPGP